MNSKIFGLLAVQAIEFPDEIELRVYPHDRETRQPHGGFYSHQEPRSWTWLQQHVPLQPHGWANVERSLKDGECASLGDLREYEMVLSDDADGPGVIQSGRA